MSARWLAGPVMAVLAALLSAVAWTRLPQQVPVQWNLDGEPDRFAGRLVAALLIPAVMLVLWALMRWLPTIDPRRQNYASFSRAYELTVNAVLGAMLVIHAVSLGLALGYPLPVQRIAPVVVGSLLVVIGLFLPQARPNWWFGIRTPWTLSSDRVWERTHWLGGRLMVGAGVLVVLSAALPPRPGFVVFMTAVVGSSLLSLVYSYLVWRQEYPT
jgi:uncharacterized membrane protein